MGTKVAGQQTGGPPREWGLAFVVFCVASILFLSGVVPFALEHVPRNYGFNAAVGIGITLVTGVIGIAAGLKAISTRDGFLIGCAIGFSGFSLLYGGLIILSWLFLS